MHMISFPLVSPAQKQNQPKNESSSAVAWRFLSFIMADSILLAFSSSWVCSFLTLFVYKILLKSQQNTCQCSIGHSRGLIATTLTLSFILLSVIMLPLWQSELIWIHEEERFTLSLTMWVLYLSIIWRICIYVLFYPLQCVGLLDVLCLSLKIFHSRISNPPYCCSTDEA